MVSVGTRYYVLDEAGKMAREGSLGNTREQLAKYGTKLSWRHCGDGSRHAQSVGEPLSVGVGSSSDRGQSKKETRAIYENERKSDRRDAMMLARLARMDPTLLHPIEHGSQEAQQEMLQLKLRDST